MKKILVFSVLVVIMHTNIKAQWIQTNGPSSGYLSDLTSDGTNIYIAGSSQNNSNLGPGVFHLNNNGTNWTQINNGLTNTSIKKIITNGNYVFAASNSGLYRKSSTANNWTQINNGSS